jgi:type IV pilus assembly protein PilA
MIMEAAVSKKFNRFRNQKGLTLIELLAVVVVLGIIAAIAVPSVTGVINKSKIKADLGSYQIIVDAGMRYALAENADDETKLNITELVSAGYLNDAPSKQSDKIKGFGSIKINLDGNKYTITVYEEEKNNQVTEINKTKFE